MDEEGWQTLLNGSDLSGWNVVGDANWRVEERAARADRSTAASFLVSEDSFANFDLELEFWVDTEANSGVFLRCQDAGTITDTSCYEANIFDTRPDQTYRTGSIVNVAEPAEFVYTGGQWNRLKITADGTRLQVTLNGRAMVDTKDSRFSRGPIALQYAAGHGHVPERPDPGTDVRITLSPLKQRAKRHARSMEEEVRHILRTAVQQRPERAQKLGSRIAERFRGSGLSTELPELRGVTALAAEFDS